MEDSKIIELLFDRQESGLEELQCKYFSYCLRIAVNLLSDGRDAEECVSDTFLQAWNSIPPERPKNLRAWLGKVVRFRSFDLWKARHRQKRYGGITEALDELEESIPSPDNMERELESAELGSLISQWLRDLPREDRILFVRRYWYGLSLRELAKEIAIEPGKLAQKMYRLRSSLRSALEKGGHTL